MILVELKGIGCDSHYNASNFCVDTESRAR